MPATTVNDILGPQGVIARRLGDAYEHRPQQLEMAAAVERAIEARQHLLVEAGTGVIWRVGRNRDLNATRRDDDRSNKSLGRAFPNPNGGPSSVTFTLDRPARVSLAVFDVTGRMVRNVLDREMTVGTHEAAWDGKDGLGRTSSPGLYFYRLALPERTEQTRTLVLKR